MNFFTRKSLPTPTSDNVQLLVFGEDVGLDTEEARNMLFELACSRMDKGAPLPNPLLKFIED